MSSVYTKEGTSVVCVCVCLDRGGAAEDIGRGAFPNQIKEEEEEEEEENG